MAARTYPYGTKPTGGGGSGGNTSAKGLLGAVGGFLGGPAGSLLGTLAGGLFGKSEAAERNRLAREEAQRNRAFQERMRNTAYQAAAGDLEKAGLNRILALGKPAATPPGNMAQIQDEGAAAIQGAATGLALKRQAQEIRNLKAQESNINADTNLKNETAITTTAQGKVNFQNWVNARTQNEIMQIDKQLKQLRIPELTAIADLWDWVNEQDMGEVLKAIGSAGPLAAAAIRLALLQQRAGKK